MLVKLGVAIDHKQAYKSGKKYGFSGNSHKNGDNASLS
jgi:hypothetical protein